jgi:ABC-type amino acid transport substrate-binding protein
MVVSVFTITILSALMTSSVLFLMNTGSQTLYHVGDLRNHSVGHLYGYPRLEMLLKKSGASTEQYPDITSLITALRNGDIEYIALGRTSLDKYYEQHRVHESLMSTSNILLGYETWSLYVNKSYGSIVFDQPLLTTINSKISHYRNDFHLFEICSHYIDTPEQCVF